MEALVDLSWRIYPAIAMMAVGAGIFAWGTRKALWGLSLPLDKNPNKMTIFVRGFRIAIIGITLAGLGASWNWHITWLFVLTLIFGGEELLESTTHLSILRRKPKTATS